MRSTIVARRLLVLLLALVLAARPGQSSLAAGLTVTGSGVTVSEDAGEQTVVLTISGVTEGGANVTMSAISSDADVIPHPAPASYPASSTVIYGDLKFTPAADAWASEVYLFVTVKQGTPSGTTTLVVVIDPVADAVTANPSPASTLEDTTTGAITLTRNAVDSDEVTHFRFGDITGGTLYGPDGATPVANGDTLAVGPGGNMSVYFAPAPDQSGPAESFGFGVRGCTSASGDGLGEATTVGVAVSAVNDAPVVTAPATAETVEDTSVVFSEFGGNAISVADVDAGSASVTLTLTGTSGTVTLASTAGVTFATGDGTDDPVIACSGTQANINAALAGLSFRPAANFSGSAALTVRLNDGGNSGSGGALQDEKTVAITVTAANDAPVITVPGAQTTNEDTMLVFSGGLGNAITVADVDAGTGELSLSLEATGGTISGTGLTGNGTASASLTGTLTAVNAALTNLRFIPTADLHGPAQLVVTVNDNGNTGGGALEDSETINITVAPIADTPSASPATTAEDTISDPIVISRNAVDGTEVGYLRLTGYSGGTLYAADGVTPIASGSYVAMTDGQLSVRFSPTANYNGTAGFVVWAAVTSSGTGISPSFAVSVTVTAVNDPPTVTAPAPQATNEDTALVFSSAHGNLISLSDIDAGSAAVAVELTATHGTLTLDGVAGLTFTAGDGVADAGMTFTGMLSDANAALSGMSFTPEAGFFGDGAQVAITVNDQGNTGSGGPLEATATVLISVTAIPDTPSVTAPAVLTEDTQGDAGTVHRNADDGDEVTHIRISGITGGTVFRADGTTPVSEGGVLAISEPDGVLLRFTPAANLNDNTSTFGFDVRACTSASCNIRSDAVHVTLAVTPVNDPPSYTKGADRLVHATGGAQVIAGWATAISPGPVDESAQTVAFTLTPASADLFSAAPALSPDGTLTYTPAVDRRGSTTVTIGCEDSEGQAAALQTFVITVNALPVVTLPGSPWTYVEGDPATIVDAVATVGDADGPDNLGGGQLSFAIVSGGEDTDRLSIGSGADTGISLSGANVLYTTTGPVMIGVLSGGSGTTPLTVALNSNATLPSVEALLRSVTYHSASENPSTEDRTVRVRLTDGIAVNDGPVEGLPVDKLIAVQAINDAPTISAPVTQAVQENTPLPFAASTANAVQVDDLDAGACTLTLAVTSLHGTFSLGDTGALSTVVGDGTTAVAATGALSAINAGLEGSRFTPDVGYRGGSASVTFVVDDGGCSGDGGSLTDTAIVTIDVRPTADLPVVTPNPATTREDVPLAGLVISRNANDGDEVTHFKITAVSSGRLYLSDGVTPVPAGSFVTVAEGAAGLVYVPVAEFSGTVTIRVRASVSSLDSGLGPETAVVTVTVLSVNDQPSFKAGPNQTVLEDAVSQTVAGWATNIDAGAANEAGQTLVFSTVAANAALFAIQPTVSSSGTLTYTPAENACGSTTVTVVLRDNGGTANGGIDTSAPKTFTITIIAVPEAPTVTGASTAEDTQTTAGLVVTRSPNDGDEVTHFRITEIVSGRLYLNDGVTRVSAGGFITVAQGAAGLRFTPAADFSGTGSVTVVAATGSTAAAAGQEESRASIVVTAVNDPPVIRVPASASTQEDTPLTFSSARANAVTITDPDASTGGLVVTLSAAHGTLTLASTKGLTFATGGGDGTADAFMEFRGTTAAINTALNGLVFVPSGDYNGTGASVLISANDGGRTGSGGVKYDVVMLPVAVTPLPERPSANRVRDVAGTSGTALVTLARNAADGSEVTHFRISAAIGGSVRLHDGTTTVADGGFVTFPQGAAGLVFVPTPSYGGFAAFTVQSATAASASAALSEPLVVPVPIGTLQSVALIPSAKASLSAAEADGNTTLSVPVGSVDASMTLAYVAMQTPNGALPGDLAFAGRAFALAALDEDGSLLEPLALKQPMTVTVSYTAAAVDGIDEETLALYRWDGTAWSDASSTCATAWSSLDTAADTLSVNVCSLSEYALLGQVETVFRAYTPATLAAYHAFTNGEFTAGLSGWLSLVGGYAGHGSGLPASASDLDGVTTALLGTPGATNGRIGVGYGGVSQSMRVSGRYLQIRYRVQTHDIVRASSGYFDTFEVSINAAPASITDAERDASGCSSALLNPEGVLVPAGDGLAFCGGYGGAAGDVGTLHDLGWRTASLDLTGYSGSITLYLTVWNREAQAPYYDDRGWYNTVAYIDYVRFSDTP